MNPLQVNFEELYRRHLCRHSQFGINASHLLAVVGTYLALFGLAFALFDLLLPADPSASDQWPVISPAIWPVLALLAVYFGVLAFNIPLRLWIINTIAVLLILGLYIAMPKPPVWVYPLLILACHQFQNWSHRVYTECHDMTAFKAKYRKGLALFVLLSLYELPILLNYLVFDRKGYAAQTAPAAE